MARARPVVRWTRRFASSCGRISARGTNLRDVLRAALGEIGLEQLIHNDQELPAILTLAIDLLGGYLGVAVAKSLVKLRSSAPREFLKSVDAMTEFQAQCEQLLLHHVAQRRRSTGLPRAPSVASPALEMNTPVPRQKSVRSQQLGVRCPAHGLAPGTTRGTFARRHTREPARARWKIRAALPPWREAELLARNVTEHLSAA